jgi:molybdenum cofactor cytidylyltransferase
MNKPSVNGLLISAGLSGRMGEFKPLMLFNEIPFVVIITKKMLSVCDKVVIVTGYKSHEIETTIQHAFTHDKLFEKIRLVYNPDYEKGMFTSLQAGIKQMEDAEWVLYHFVDQPFHSIKFYEEMIYQIDNDYDWVQPKYETKEGHPVLFKKTLFEKIIESPSNFWLRFIRDDDITKKKNWETGYSQILKDFDTRDDIEKFK